MSIARVLAIAGSDSGGGAGIQADIKTITMLGGHAMTAITAVTAQNSLVVVAVEPIAAAMVIAQIEAVADDLGLDAIKIGMVGSAATADALAERLPAIGVPIVFDPVMIASSGASLADGATIAAFERLMRIATLVTPNGAELEALTGRDVTTAEEALHAARLLSDRLGCAVLAKGGHVSADFAGTPVVRDQLVSAGEVQTWSASRIETRHNHGTGCTLASAITTGLAQGWKLSAAIERARSYVRAALKAAPGIGGGAGPMGHALGVTPYDRLRDPQRSPGSATSSPSVSRT